MSVMDIKGLTFAYPNGKEILHGIDLAIGEGEFVLLCGPSGCCLLYTSPSPRDCS
mgnify:FL=1